MKWNRVKFDLQYMLLNRLVNGIPSWSIRRWIYIKYGMQIGENARIGIGTIVVCPQNIKIGSRVNINENCVLDGRGGLTVGHDTSVSMFSKILSASHKADSSHFEYYTKKTIIGHHVWVGTSAVLLDGSKIGNYSVIGANAVLKGTVGKKTIMVGNPAKEIRKRMIDGDYDLNYKAYFR